MKRKSREELHKWLHPHLELVKELAEVKDEAKGTALEDGTSLGLIICKGFISANGGKLEVQSKVGKGTTFSFTLKGKLEI